ncbi:unnamed protein product [Durusdinium trenchii]|uniref:Uncharacterized protein n=2 Tax=Durusdinium trenchii TaxID=1381693 RepID=A0ABP0K1M8_9DINO
MSRLRQLTVLLCWQCSLGRHGAGFQPLPSGGAVVKIYAPHATQVSIVGSWNGWMPDSLVNLSDGWWELNISSEPTRDYLFQIGAAYKIFLVSEDGRSYWRPDPWSRLQDGTTLGNSLTYFDEKFQWTDANWSMPHWDTLVIYELHVGSFCAYEGWTGTATLDMCIPKLEHLVELGINAVELLPVAEFDGTVDWGYTTAYPFAVEVSYGGQDAFKRFVNACHQKGLAVLLDVVYNHLGPMDLPLWQFDGWSNGTGLGGIYFYNDHRAETPWAHTRPNYGVPDVRRFFVDNALFWLDTMHCDGLRVDGVSFIRLWGGSETNRSAGTFNPEGELFLKELSAAVRKTGKMLIAEDLQGNMSLTEELPKGLGFNSQWDGRFHWTLLKNLRQPDAWRNMSDLQQAILADLGGGVRRTIYAESHDEAGRFRLPLAISGRRDSWVGSRLSALATALVMLSPGIPLIFQGQEFALQELFSAHQPMDWSQLASHRGTFKLHQDLVALRRVQGLGSGTGVNVTADETNKILTLHRWKENWPSSTSAPSAPSARSVFAIFNFQRRALVNFDVTFPKGVDWNLALNTADARYYNMATVFHEEDQGPGAFTPIESPQAGSTGTFIHPYSCKIYTGNLIKGI